MKNLIVALAVIHLLLISCAKNNPETAMVSETATIAFTKYPCGPACTADAWLLVTANNSFYEPINLPDNYKVSNLSVLVTLKKTGLRSSLPGGTAGEKVEVIEITKR